MDRREVLAAVGVVGVAGFAGCRGGSSPGSGGLSNGSFEDDLDGWTVGRDLPEDPNDPGDGPVDAEASVTDARASDGEQALQLAIDGRQDDGTLWVQQEVDLSGVTGLAVDGYSESESFNQIAKIATYAGPVPDGELREADFDTSAASEDHEGWKTYEYEIDHHGRGLVAVGISVVWETEVVRVLDAVRLQQSGDGDGGSGGDGDGGMY